MNQNTVTQNTPLNIVIVGHVDHGKSTLIGRLLYDTNSLEDGKYEELEMICKKRGTDVMEWSFLLDSYQAERDQAVTIDTTQIRFKTEQRPYVIIDAPGHREFLKNMISGASQADAAILVVDAEEGLQEQTRRHAYLLKLLGLSQIAVVINKMDAVNNSEERFLELEKECERYLADLHVAPQFVLPISARSGDMIANRNDNMAWYKGPTVIEMLDQLDNESSLADLPLRLPIQDVYRHNEKRILVGRIESGELKVGDQLFFSPMNEFATVTSIETWPKTDHVKTQATTGESVAFTIDKPLFVERGHIASHNDEEHLPLISNIFRSHLFWLSDKALKVGNTYKVRYGTAEGSATVHSIQNVVNTQDLAKNEDAKGVERNDVAEVTLRMQQRIALDEYQKNPRTGRIVIYDGLDIVGGGLISMEGYPNQRQIGIKSENIYEVDHLLTHSSRAERNGHHGGIFWFTGLSGAGKSTLAMKVEKRLFSMGYYTYVLDGDNVRHGLNSDLGFSPDDRTENIRRIGEVAALMSDAGMVVVTAFISPYRTDRNRARAAAEDKFNEIYVKADLATCEQRDPKGLYKKARDGQIKEFTGIDSPYQAPDNPELVVDTENNDIKACVEYIVDYIVSQVSLNKKLTKKSA